MPTLWVPEATKGGFCSGVIRVGPWVLALLKDRGATNVLRISLSPVFSDRSWTESESATPGLGGAVLEVRGPHVALPQVGTGQAVEPQVELAPGWGGPETPLLDPFPPRHLGLVEILVARR